MQRALYLATAAVFVALIVGSLWSLQVLAAATKDVPPDAHEALTWLYRIDASAKALGHRARAVLVFPKITKATIVQFGATVDAAYGKGSLIRAGAPSEPHYFMSRTWALKRDDQSYSVALFIMSDKAQQSLAKGEWDFDNDPTVAIVDEALPKPNPLPKADAYAFVFGTNGVAAVVLVRSSTILANR